MRGGIMTPLPLVYAGTTEVEVARKNGWKSASGLNHIQPKDFSLLFFLFECCLWSYFLWMIWQNEPDMYLSICRFFLLPTFVPLNSMMFSQQEFWLFNTLTVSQDTFWKNADPEMEEGSKNRGVIYQGLPKVQGTSLFSQSSNKSRNQNAAI